MPRTLTKSRFKLANECPTRLFYTGKSLYPDTALEDSFLIALADGGHQVGMLATRYHPGGIRIETLDYEEALDRTDEQLRRDQVILYEAAIHFEQLFVRVDVLVKRGDHVELIEVKAKSCDGDDPGQFLTNAGSISSSWKPYLEDVTFQKYVLEHAYPELSVTAYLMLVDKGTTCPTDGLHQKFLLATDERGRTIVDVVGELTDDELQNSILRKIDVDAVAGEILASGDHGLDADLGFEDWLRFLSGHYARDEKIPPRIGTQCGECPFHATTVEKDAGRRSGFEECWSTLPGWSADAPTVLDIWNLRRKDRLLDQGKVSIHQVEMADIGHDGTPGEELSRKARQWLQVEKAQNGDPSMELRREPLRREMETWTFPLHFIDFETATPAIPLHRGRHPYGQLAFQFSHHVVHEDGRVEHAGQFLHDGLGIFPNYDFVRALKAELEHDEGTIFRYAAHENTVLCAIHAQLATDGDSVPDGAELRAFIESICHPTGTSPARWAPPVRDMVDLLQLVARFYYDPAMGGSCSMKKVLPAVLGGSNYLQRKYAEPIYGADPGIPSFNQRDLAWVVRDEDGRVKDPYELLPPLFGDLDERGRELLMGRLGELREGGAAMTAYVRMQFEEMEDFERDALRVALLKYCELDTLAMVMLYEAWREWVA